MTRNRAAGREEERQGRIDDMLDNGQAGTVTQAVPGNNGVARAHGLKMNKLW